MHAWRAVLDAMDVQAPLGKLDADVRGAARGGGLCFGFSCAGGNLGIAISR